MKAKAAGRRTEARRIASPVAAVLTVVALLGPLYLKGLGGVDIIGDDEAREVGIIQDIAERGHWLLPSFNATALPDKPILYHWLGAAACRVGGSCSEYWVRLPSVMAALGLIGLVGFAGARLFGLAEGIAGGMLLGLSPFFFERARSARPDMLVSLATAATLFAFFAWWRAGRRSRPREFLIGSLLGIAILAKGPVAPVLVATTIFVFLAVRRDLRRGRDLLRAHVMVPAFVIGGTWYVAALVGWGGRFARKHLIGRYLGNVVGGELAVGVHPHHSLSHHLIFYPLHLLLATFPWTPLLIVAVVAIWRDKRRRADPRVQFLQVWIATVVAVFSFAAFKLRHYLLPALPAAALLAAPLAQALAGRAAGGRSGRLREGRRVGGERTAAHRVAVTLRQPVILSLVVTIAAGLAATLLWTFLGSTYLSRSDRDLAAAIFATAEAYPLNGALVGLAGAALFTAAFHATLLRRWDHLLGLTAAAMIAWMLWIEPGVQATLAAKATLKPFAEAIDRKVPASGQIYFYGRVLRPVVIYTHRTIPRLRRDTTRLPAGQSYVIVTETDLPELLQAGLETRTLASHRGRTGNLARGRVLLMEITHE